MAAVPLFRVPLEDVGGEVAMRFVESCTNELRDKGTENGAPRLARDGRRARRP